MLHSQLDQRQAELEAQQASVKAAEEHIAQVDGSTHTHTKTHTKTHASMLTPACMHTHTHTHAHTHTPVSYTHLTLPTSGRV